MKKQERDKMVEDILECTDRMSFGSSSTTCRIAIQLGYENVDRLDLIDVDYEVMSRAESRGYILDKSHHDGKLEELAQNLDFIKRKLDA